MFNLKWLAFSIMVLSILGCTGASMGGANQVAPEPAPQATEVLQSSPASEEPSEQELVVQSALDFVVAAKGISEGDASLVSVTPAEWPTSALGCPEQGMMYAQVITSGFELMWEINGETVEVHVSGSGEAVICDAKESDVTLEINVPAEAQPAVLAALNDLAQRISVELNQIMIESFDIVEWSDSSLGCPEPGKMYSQVITPGYRIMLKSGDMTYEYHANQGDRVVYCGPDAGLALGKPLDFEEVQVVISKIMQDLSTTKGVEFSDITVSEVQLVDDSSMQVKCSVAGKFDPSKNVLQIILTVKDALYVYQSQGAEFLLCDG